jgi:hypothetical protein
LLRRGPLYGALLGTLVALPATPGLADESAPNWNCRASVLQSFEATELETPRFEPLVANGDGTAGTDRAACADDSAGLPVVSSPGESPLTVSAQEPFAATALNPDTGAARDQAAAAVTTAKDVTVSTPGGEVTITATALRAQAGAQCVNGVPTLDGSSSVSNLKVNGEPLPLDDTMVGEISQQVSDSPLGGVIKVRVNQKLATADSLTVEALRVELFSAAGTPQAVTVFGAAKVARTGDTCAPAQTATTPTPTGTNGTNGAPGTNGSNGTNSTTAPAPTTTGSGANVRKVVINGRNGGCGRIKVWFEKVDLLHRLPGKPMKATSRFGQRVMIRGELISCAGKPIVGARLTQTHFVGKGVGRLLKTGVKTREGGHFTYIEPLNLTTRRIAFSYRGNLASKRITSRKVLRLTVKNRKGKIMRGRPPRTLE